MFFHRTDQTIEHIAQNSITPEEWEQAFVSGHDVFNRGSNLPARTGYDITGRKIFVTFIDICGDETVIEPVTGILMV